MRALVTGACGFVGTHLARHLLEQGDEVLGTVLHTPNPTPPFETVRLDVTDAGECARVIRDFRPEVIYHLAGIAFVPEAENDFQRTLAINVGGTNNVFSVCHLLELPVTVVLVSSAEVYGAIDPEQLPLTENSPIRPANNYSLSKAMAELVVHRYSRSTLIRSVIMRPFNHIGPGQDARFVASSFARQLASIRAGRTKPVLSVGNLLARRDFTDVRDVVRAYRLAAARGQAGLFQVSSGRAISIQAMLDELIDLSGLEVEIRPDPSRMRPSEVPELFGSFDRANRLLNWKPAIPLRQTLQDIYEYWCALV